MQKLMTVLSMRDYSGSSEKELLFTLLQLFLKQLSADNNYYKMPF